MGISFATSILSGSWLAVGSQKLKNLLAYKRRTDRFIIVGMAAAFLFVLVDVYTFVGFNTNENLYLFLAFFITIMQTLTAVVYIWATNRFIKFGLKRVSMSMAGGSVELRKQMLQRFKAMSRYLKLSAVCMLFVSLLSVVYSMSGTFYYGFWDPNVGSMGWVLMGLQVGDIVLPGANVPKECTQSTRREFCKDGRATFLGDVDEEHSNGICLKCIFKYIRKHDVICR